MSEGLRRPLAVLVIGWCSIGVGLLGLAGGVGGVMTAFDPDPVFEHEFVIGLLACALAVLVIGAARALLHLRMWGAVVIQVLAILSLLFFAGLGTLFAWLSVQTGGAHRTSMVATGVGVAALYAIPSIVV